MRRSLYRALGLGALLSWPAGAAFGQQWFFYPTNAQTTQAPAYPYSVPADFPRPYGPPPQAPQPNYYPNRAAYPASMPQTVYYPMPNQTAAPMAPMGMPPAPMPAPVQRAMADVTAAPAPLPAAGAPAVAPSPSAPVLLHDPVVSDGMSMSMSPGPVIPHGYRGMPTSVTAADVPSDSPWCRTGWIGGASVYLLKPYINDNSAFNTTRGNTVLGTDPVTGVPTSVTAFTRSATDFDYDLSASPGGWIGYIGPQGIGFRVGYFHFDEEATPLSTTLTTAEATTPTGFTLITAPATITSQLPGATFVSPSPSVTAADTSGLGADVLRFSTRLRVDYLDAEGACDFQLGRCWSLFVTAGCRWLNMSSDYAGFIVGSGVPIGTTAVATERLTLLFGHNFVGAGPTVALQARWAPPDAHLAVFGSVRGAMAIGRARQNYGFSDVFTSPSPALPSSTTTSEFDDRRDWIVPCAELEVGLEYAMCVYHTRPFIRASAINQTYFGFGSASRTDTDFGLFGAELSLGLNY
jgi:hypothetical protein